MSEILSQGSTDVSYSHGVQPWAKVSGKLCERFRHVVYMLRVGGSVDDLYKHIFHGKIEVSACQTKVPACLRLYRPFKRWKTFPS